MITLPRWLQLFCSLPESKHIESVLCTMIKLRIYVHIHATEEHKTTQNTIFLNKDNELYPLLSYHLELVLL